VQAAMCQSEQFKGY